MPYSPIRLEQLNQSQLSTFIITEVDGRYLSLSGDQTVSGNKTFANPLFSLTEPSGGFGIVNKTYLETGEFELLNVVRTTGTQTIGGEKTFTDSLTYQGEPVGGFGVVNKGYLETGDFNLSNVVRTTGNQTILGQKQIGTGFFSDGSAISLYGPTGNLLYDSEENLFRGLDGIHSLDIENRKAMLNNSTTTLYWGNRLLAGLWSGDNDYEVADPTKGVILRSPDNSRWRITVDNSGNLSASGL